jgi:hypothetical protein
MTAQREKPPQPMMRKTGSILSPVTAWDAELLADIPDGAEFDIARRSPRSKPHNGMYWAQLGLIIKATDAWPTAPKMHEWVKLRLAYTAPVFGPKGEVVGMTIDSTAFDKMTQAEFNSFYEKAAALIAVEMGIDLADVVPGWSI